MGWVSLVHMDYLPALLLCNGAGNSLEGSKEAEEVESRRLVPRQLRVLGYCRSCQGLTFRYPHPQGTSSTLMNHRPSPMHHWTSSCVGTALECKDLCLGREL